MCVDCRRGGALCAPVRRVVGTAFVLVLAVLSGCTGELTDGNPRRLDTSNDHPRVNDSWQSQGAHEGNALDHAEAFACQEGVSAASPARLVRLDSYQYHRLVVGVVGRRLTRSLTQGSSWNPFEGIYSTHRFGTFARGVTIDEATLDALLLTNDLFSDYMTRSDPAPHPAAAEYIVPCVKDGSEYQRECAEGVLQELLLRAFRRPADPQELARYVELVESNVAELGKVSAFRLAFESALTSPSALYRSEFGDPQVDGPSPLAPYELATAIAYALDDSPPTDAMLRAVAAGDLSSAHQIKAHVQRVLSPPEQSDSAERLQALHQHYRVLLRFVRELFRYPRALAVFKDDPEYEAYLQMRRDQLPQDQHRYWAFVPREWIRDTDEWVLEQLATRGQVLERLLTAANYEGRTGLMSQRSFLVAHSQATETDPIRRGRFVFENLLCNEVPELPLDVVPVLPEIEGATLRERLATYVSEERCAGCHKFMDPIGLSFEGYHHYMGQQRFEEEGRPVETSGHLVGAGDDDGPVADVAELSERLAGSERARQCFVRHAFRYWMGRNERRSDACTLRQLDDAYLESDGDLVAVIAELVTSDAFRMREKVVQR